MHCKECNTKKKPHQLRKGVCITCLRTPKPTKVTKSAKTTRALTLETEGPQTLTALNSMLKNDLIALAGEVGSSAKGTKVELVQRLAKKLKIKSQR